MYCNELIPGDSEMCPMCGRKDPFSLRCPRCKNPIENNWKICSSCGIKLKTICISCGKEIPTAEFCEYCKGPILVRCKNRKCLEVQILTPEGKCIKCGNKI